MIEFQLNVAKENLGGKPGPGLVSIPTLISIILFIEEKMCSHDKKHSGLKMCINMRRKRAGEWQAEQSLIGNIKMLGMIYFKL